MRRLPFAPTLGMALTLGACRPQAVGPAPETRPDPCALTADSAVPAAGADLMLALPLPFRPDHAPIPESYSEALVFRQLYETLVFVDCEGTVRPGLARSWSSAGDRRVWEFELREARFQDGRTVTPQHIADSWASSPHAARLGVAPESVTVLDARRLRVATDRPATAPYLFAEPALAVATRPIHGTDASLPVGSGPLTLTLAMDRMGQTRLALVAADGTALFTIRRIQPTSARDALDFDVDLVVTDDADAVDYARGRTDLAAVPLPWDRTYVLAAHDGPLVPRDDAAAFAASLRDAVRADAQAAAPPFWWERLPAGCLGPDSVAPRTPSEATERVLYEQGDAPARSLAARIVALALLERGLRVETLDAPEFRAAVETGGDRYVLAVPRRVFDACAAARDLVTRAPWLSGTLDAAPTQSLTPLIDVRRHVLARALPVGATIDWDGVIRFSGR